MENIDTPQVEQQRTIKRKGSADIAAVLRREILSGQLLCHDRLPAERAMADRHGVSRGTVREALVRLERERLVEIRPGSGTYVIHAAPPPMESPIESARPLELMDARFALEPHICRLAVLHARRADFERFETLLNQMDACGNDAVAFGEADSLLHTALAQSTGNNLLIWIIGQMNDVRGQGEWTRMRQLTLDPKIIAQYNAEHRQIVNAIRSRDAERAATMMKAHLETARLSLTRASET
ncbi:MAG: FadR/GntR family transcriptional regulator [Pikeienuella sp.]